MVKSTHIHKFIDHIELKNAIKDYPSNIDKYGNISNWNVSNIQNMKGLFEGNKCCDISIYNWDVSSVTTMESMFYNSSFNTSKISEITINKFF